MSEAILKIPSSITTALSVAALAVLVVYLIYEALLKSRLLRRVSSNATRVLLGRIVNWVGALALVALVMALIPPILRITIGNVSAADVEDSVEKLNAAMSNVNKRHYDDGTRMADAVLEKDPKSFRAYNIKGSAAFLQGNYKSAIENFSTARQLAPSNAIIARNLGDAYVEADVPERALDLYKMIDDGKPDASYSLGRAYVYLDRPDEALKYLRSVPTRYASAPDNPGTARVLEAAALEQLARHESDAAKRLELQTGSRARLREAIEMAPDYWKGILYGGRSDEHEGYTKATRLLSATEVAAKP